MVLVNILTDLANPTIFNVSDGYSAGYLFGSHLFFFVGVILIIIAYRQARKGHKMERSQLDESIENIGK